MTPSLLVFDTTHHAMWAEQVVLRAGLAADIQPSPAAARAKCALALAYLPDEETDVIRVLDDAGVPYRCYPERMAPQ